MKEKYREIYQHTDQADKLVNEVTQELLKVADQKGSMKVAFKALGKLKAEVTIAKTLMKRKLK